MSAAIVSPFEVDDTNQAHISEVERHTFGSPLKDYVLVEVSAGYECAGSMMRWTDGYTAVWIYDGSGSRGGRHVPSLDAGRELIAAWQARHEEQMDALCFTCKHPMREHGPRYTCPV